MFICTLTSCAGTGHINESLAITDAQVDHLLKDFSLFRVNELQIDGMCPVLANRYSQPGIFLEGRQIAECVKIKDKVIYVLHETDLQTARRHAASHVYEVKVLGIPIEESADHRHW